MIVRRVAYSNCLSVAVPLEPTIALGGLGKASLSPRILSRFSLVHLNGQRETRGSLSKCFRRPEMHCCLQRIHCNTNILAIVLCSSNRHACPLQQKSQWFPDNPDVTIVSGIKGVPFLHCEVKPTRSSRVRVAWDVVRLVRFGRCALACGHEIAPLLQVVGRKATYMRLKDNEGLLVLGKVGTFQVPLVLDHLPDLAKTCMVLYEAKVSFRILQTLLPDDSSDAHLVCFLHHRKTLSLYSIIRPPLVWVML